MIKRILLCILNLLAITHFAISQVEDTTFQYLEEVTIESEKEKKVVFEDPKYYIVDFAIRDTHALMLMRNFGTYYLYELDESMNYRHKLKLNFDADFLFDDCFGNTYVVSKDSVYHVFDDTYGLFITEKHLRREFMSAIEKCVGETTDKIVLKMKSDYTDKYVFYTIDRESGDRKVIYEMEDSPLSKSMRRAAAQLYQIGYLEKDQLASDSHGGSLRETYNAIQDEVDSLRTEREDFSRATFGTLHAIKQKYNALFTLDDTIYVFNHYDCKIDVLDQTGTLMRSIPITYHLRRNWHEQIYVDRIRKEFYAVYMRNGVQRLIRLGLSEDSQDSSAKITKHAYPEKVVVRDGVAYYTYKPNVDANLNKLYMQKL
ncbi:MAG: hypothetical protein AB8B56_03175 [Crocinitomicaceae bacterium]